MLTPGGDHDRPAARHHALIDARSVDHCVPVAATHPLSIL